MPQDGAGILEVRVHGVHGTTPASMLGTTAVGQVAGDGLTGLYRTTDGCVPNRTLPKNMAVEAYSWGNLTSGVGGLLGWVRRAGWLFLLPFALANLAYWARPELGTNTAAARRTARYVRTGALLLTALVVLTACLLGIDLLAWQCYRGGTPGCGALPGLLDFLARDPWQTVPRRIAVGSVVPLLVVAGLWLLSGRSAARLEEVRDPDRPERRGGAAPLERGAMWDGRITVLRLRRLHIAFALVVVIVYTGAPVVQLGLGSDKASVWTWLQAGVLAAAALLGAVVVWTAGSLRPGDVECATEPGDDATGQGGQLLRASVLLLVVHLALLVLPPVPGRLDEGGDLAGHNVWFIATLVGLAAVGVLTFCSGKRTALHVGAGFLVPVLLLASSTYVGDEVGLPREVTWSAWGLLLVGWLVMLLRQYRGRDDSPTAWRGAGASLLLNAAGWTALLFTTAVVTLAADQLNGSAHDVADLQTHYAASQVGSALNAQDLDLVDDGDPTGRYVYRLGGDVRVVGGVVDVSSDRVVVRSGRLETDTLVRVLPGADADSRRVAVRLGTTEMHNSVLVLPEDGSLVVQDGCLRSGADTETEPPETCTVEEPGFVASASLDTKGAEVGVRTVDKRPDVDVAVSDPPQAPLVLPQVLVWAPIVQVVWFLVALVLAGVCLLRLSSRLSGPVRAVVEADPTVPAKDRDACVRARVRAAYVHRAERLLDLLGAMTVPIVLVLIVGASTGKAPWRHWSGFRPLAELALWGVLGFSLALVLVLSRMRKDDGTRKGVGILWDLTTFWPRAAHPLAPPCYAERVVPELLVRVRWVLRDTRHLVVLSGHSQGSAILMAVASRLTMPELQRVRIITYGSQIRAWYGRIFPAVLGPEPLGYAATSGTVRFADPEPDAPRAGTAFPADAAPPAPDATGSLRARLLAATSWTDSQRPPWVNLFRRSDPLGFRVFSNGEGTHDLYVPEVPVEPSGDPGPLVMTHSGYPHTAAYRETVEDWARQVPPGTWVPPFRTAAFFPEP